MYLGLRSNCSELWAWPHFHYQSRIYLAFVLLPQPPFTNALCAIGIGAAKLSLFKNSNGISVGRVFDSALPSRSNLHKREWMKKTRVWGFGAENYKRGPPEFHTSGCNACSGCVYRQHILSNTMSMLNCGVMQQYIYHMWAITVH